MKKLFAVSFLLLLFKFSFACSCGQGKTFCSCHDDFSIAVSGVVVDSFEYGISIKILHLLNGIENRDTINVWDFGGPYDMCNDSASVSKASFLGNVGDTLIIALPKIDTIKNSWDIIGDYRTPGFICDEHKLRVVNNTVLGLVADHDYYCFYFNDCLWGYNYDDFINEFPTKILDCLSWVGVDEKINNQSTTIYPNPFTNQLHINTPKQSAYQVTDYLGKTVLSGTTDNAIETKSLAPGNYLLILKNADDFIIRKIMKE
jgi:hypothetical protein